VGSPRKSCTNKVFLKHLTPPEVAMIAFLCETCGKLKKPEQNWILGMAAESLGAVSERSRDKHSLRLGGIAGSPSTCGAFLLRALQGALYEQTF